jgi:hypothetical protein
MKNWLFLMFLLSIFQLHAQLGFEYSDSIPVKVDGNFLKMPWAGGLSYAQFSDIDVDFDGDLDLFVFDRSSDNIRVFLNEEENGVRYYKLLYNGHLLFPSEIRYRATTIDYNGDGKNDLFCYGIGGIQVYKNVGDAVNGLQWEMIAPVIYSDNWGSQLNLYVSSADIPAIVDVDGDGDLDILTFHIGGQHLQYHKNMSMENHGNADSMDDFVLMNECWGGFREDINTNFIFLNDNTPPCSTGNIPNAESPTLGDELSKSKLTEQTPKHSGSTILALDINNSGVMDLILGDVAFNNLNLLINGGAAVNTNSPMISVDPLFPSNSVPVNLELFPAAFHVDVDFDGKKDILVGTNGRNVSENVKSVWFYKNTGTNELPNFIYQTNAFLQREMIEHGTGSIPVLVDIDNDGKTDLFVANFFRHKTGLQKESTIAYYKNTGTDLEPEFTLIDNNFLNLSQQLYGFRMLPTFGDLDGDGKMDMIIGREDGTLVYYRNTSNFPSISFAAPITNYTDNLGATITAGQYASPQLFDLNDDGLLDLIVGKKTGELIYYENIGTTLVPSFQLKNSMLGNVDNATDSPDGYATPHFFKINNETHLFLGGIKGTLGYYQSIDENLETGQAFQLISDAYLNIRVQAYSSFFISDIDNDGLLNLFVGQDLGGLFHFEVNPESTIGISQIEQQLDVVVYPNPASQLIHVRTHEAGELTLRVLNAFGQELTSQQFTQQTELDIQSFAAGIYILVLSNDQGATTIKRIVKN